MSATYQEIIKEFGEAINNYAKVRHTEYEMILWRDYGLPLAEVNNAAKRQFSQTFLKGKRIDYATKAEIDKAFIALGFAAGHNGEARTLTGVRKRCFRLLEDLNKIFAEEHMEPIGDFDNLLDWLTFSYKFRKDHDNEPIMEKPYRFYIRDFYDSDHRKEFMAEARRTIKRGCMLSFNDLARIVNIRLTRSRSLPT